MDKSSRNRWRRPRALGTVVAAVVMVVVLVATGLGAYFAFNGSKTTGGGSNSVSSCQPSNSPICSEISGGHDVILSEPFRVTDQNTTIPFTADYVGSGSVTSYIYTFGDGTNLTTSAPIAQHAYQYPGTYLASVQASVKGHLHDNFNRLLLIDVSPSVSSGVAQYLPTVGGVIVSNGTSGATNPTGIVGGSTSVEVNGSYSAAPSDPSAIPIAPTLTYAKGGTYTAGSMGAAYVTGTVSYANPGTYWVTMVGGATLGKVTYTQDYTWTVFVAPPGTHGNYVVAGAGTSAVPGGGSAYKSPHKGVIDAYKFVGSPPVSEDPAIDYETLGFEPILNVYQTLIAYNQSQTGITYASYVPQLATCVPGSPQCQSQWGASFTGISPDGKNFTFVIDPKARFYDPGTGKSWPVYPSDVAFSLIRTMAFADLPGFGSNPGWIETQALLNFGNGSWDTGYHSPFNNTPANMWAALGVNDSNCPANAMSHANGCITFHADSGGILWPFFLELIVDAEGSAVVPCGWFSAAAQGAGIPDWTQGVFPPSDHGDHPCTLPGGATSTTASAFTTAVAAMGATDLDAWEVAATNSNTGYLGHVQWNMVGSGPYYMAQLIVGQSYTLKANPAYSQPNCGASTGCEPAPGSYPGTVNTIWENDPTQGEQGYQAGTADFAGVPVTQLSFLLKLVNAGSVELQQVPSISIFFWPFNLNFSVSTEQSLFVPQVNVPHDWFSNVGMRQFFVHAYPYSTSENTIGTLSGIQLYQNYGGAIPHEMANYYGGNISWPAGDPNGTASTVGTAAWWWAQASTNNGNPYYDPETAACTTGSPCIISMIGQTAAPDVDERIALWAKSINTISGGKVELLSADTTFGTLVHHSTADAPGVNPMPVFQLGWAPDYPDPTDYVTPMYLPDNTYTRSDAVSEQVNMAAYDAGSCHSSSDYGWWANEANTVGIPNNCQGAAYDAMTAVLNIAGLNTNAATRLVQYWQAQSIANGLALYVYWGQQNTLTSYASWINGNSINANVTIGGGNVFLWYALTGNGIA